MKKQRLLNALWAFALFVSSALLPILFAGLAYASQTISATVDENQTLTLTAPSGYKIDSISFASYGTPVGNTIGDCHASNSFAKVQQAISNESLSIVASNDVFGDPCVGVGKRLTVVLVIEPLPAPVVRSLATPSNLQGQVDGSTATLNWSAPVEGNTPVERYAIFWSFDNWQSGFAIASTTLSASVGNLPNGVVSFKVRADNDTYAVYSGWSNEVSLTIGSVPTPEPSSSPSPAPVDPTPEPSPTSDPTPSPSPSPTAEPSSSPSASPEPTSSPSPSSTASPQPSEASPSPTESPTPSPTPDPIQTTEPAPSPTPIPEPVPEPTPQPQPAVEPEPAPQPVEPSPQPTLEPEIEPVPLPEPPVDVEPIDLEPVPVDEPTVEPTPAEPTPVEEPQPIETIDPETPVVEETLETSKVLDDVLNDGQITPSDVEAVVDSLMEDGEITQSEVNDLSETLSSDGQFTQEEKQLVATVLIESADGEAITVESIAEAGLALEDLPPATPVELRQDENGNAVIITAVVADALQLLESPAAILTAIFESPAELIFALGNLGADMSDEERDEATKTIVAATIVGNIAASAAVTASLGAVGYRRNP
jgi:hypothetical protein